MSNFVSNVGSIELDNDCTYSIDNRSTRSRESTVSKEDAMFYLKNYIEPKYGLENINVNNVAGFMKDLEMNWSKLTPELKGKVLDILVDSIFQENYDFKNALLAKLNIPVTTDTKSSFGTTQNTIPGLKSNFGSSSSDNNNTYIILVTIIGFVILIGILSKKN